MHLPALSARSARKAPLIEFFAMSILQGRKTGFSLYEAPVALQVTYPELMRAAHEAAESCLLVVEKGAPDLPGIQVDTQQASRLCSACIDAMLEASTTGRLAHQEKEWLKAIFETVLPIPTARDIDTAIVSMALVPASFAAAGADSNRYGYEIEKEQAGIRKQTAASGLAILIQRQEAIKAARIRATQTPSLRAPKQVKIQSPEGMR